MLPNIVHEEFAVHGVLTGKNEANVWSVFSLLRYKNKVFAFLVTSGVTRGRALTLCLCKRGTSPHESCRNYKLSSDSFVIDTDLSGYRH